MRAKRVDELTILAESGKRDYDRELRLRCLEAATVATSRVYGGAFDSASVLRVAEHFEWYVRGDDAEG